MGSLGQDFRYALHLLQTCLIVVAAVWSVAAAVRARDGGTESAIRTSIAEATLAAGVVAILVMTVIPLRVPMPGQYQPPMPVNLVPVFPLISDLQTDTFWTLVNIVGNVGLYVPLGVGLAWRFRLRTVWIVAIAASVSIAVEIWQGVSGGQRTSDIDDVLLNTAGALVGSCIFMIAARSLSGYRQRSRRAGLDSSPE
jgi:glycopeptide antibiotics resistance protein